MWASQVLCWLSFGLSASALISPVDAGLEARQEVCVPGNAQPQVIVYPVAVQTSCPSNTVIVVPGCSTGITINNAPTYINTVVSATTTVTSTVTSTATAFPTGISDEAATIIRQLNALTAETNALAVSAANLNDGNVGAFTDGLDALAGDEELDERRDDVESHLAEAGGVDRDVAPAEDLQALLARELFDALAGGGDGVAVTGDEGGAHGVAEATGEVEVDHLAEEAVRDLHQDAGAVTGVGLGAGGAAVLQVAQCRERLAHDRVTGLAGHGGHEGDATGVVLVETVVQTLGWRESLHSRPPNV